MGGGAGDIHLMELTCLELSLTGDRGYGFDSVPSSFLLRDGQVSVLLWACAQRTGRGRS